MNIQALHDEDLYLMDTVEKKKKVKKPIPRAPREIVPIKCADKKGVEHWDDKSRNDDLATFHHQ